MLKRIPLFDKIKETAIKMKQKFEKKKKMK